MNKNANIFKSILASMIILPALALLISCNKTSGYTINGEIDAEGFSADSIYLYNQAGVQFASTPVKDGKFVMKGSTDEVEKAIIGNMPAQIGTNIILENGQQYTFKLTEDLILVTGGNIHDKVLGFVNSKAYADAVKDYQDTTNELLADFDENDKERAQEIEQILSEKGDVVLKLENEHFATLIEGNEPTQIKLLAITETQDWEAYPVNKRLEMLNEYEKELGKSSLIDDYRTYLNSEEEMIAAAEGVAVGKPYIDVTAQTRDKQSVALSDVIAKNKYTLLEFWASWCGPCRGEIPNLKKEYEEYKAKGFEIYAISLDDEEADWLKALDEEKTTWINVRNTDGFKGDVVNAYGVRGIPSSFLIDKEGNIVASMDQLRGKEMEKTMEELFK